MIKEFVVNKDIIDKILTVNVVLWVLVITLFYKLIIPPGIAWSFFVMIGGIISIYWFLW